MKSGLRLFLLTVGLVMLTRLPFLGPGYGVEPDAWRVIEAARVMARTGIYQPSRLPGYPVHEGVTTLLAMARSRERSSRTIAGARPTSA